MVSDDDLVFANHLSLHQNHLTGNAERDVYWHHAAQEIHALCVSDAIGEIQTDLVVLSQRIGTENGRYQILLGVARRSKFIWGALRQLHSLVSPSRNTPLTIDESGEASRALNDIYIHLLGALDNYAWALLYLFCEKQVQFLHPNDIGIFAKKYQKISELSEFHAVSAPFIEWNKEIRSRRDPVAHRIPLSVPPALHDDETIAVYHEHEKRYADAFHKFSMLAGEGNTRAINAASAEVDRCFAEMQKIGKFAPFIVHHPNEEWTRIYPTAPEDIGTFIRVARELNHKILARLDTK